MIITWHTKRLGFSISVCEKIPKQKYGLTRVSHYREIADTIHSLFYLAKTCPFFEIKYILNISKIGKTKKGPKVFSRTSGSEGDLWLCYSSFHHCEKISETNNLKGGIFILVHDFRGFAGSIAFRPVARQTH